MIDQTEWERWAESLDLTRHNGPVPAGGYWACSEPERVDLNRMGFDLGCRACVVALGAVARTVPNVVYYGQASGDSRTLANCYEWARRLFDLPALP